MARKQTQKQSRSSGDSYYRRDANSQNVEDSSSYRRAQDSAQKTKDSAEQTESEIDRTLADYESSKATTGTEQSEVDNLDQGLYDSGGPTDKSKGKGWLRRNRNKLGVGGGIVGILTAGLLLLTGPLEIIHWGTLLEDFHFGSNEEATQSRISKAFRWFKYDSSQRHIRRLGSIHNRWANAAEARFTEKLGLKLNAGAAGNLESVTITDRNKAPPEMVAEWESRGLISGDTVDFSQASNFYIRSQLNAFVRGSGYKKVGTALPLRKMLHTRYAATLRPFGNVLRKKNQTTLEWYDEWRKERKQRRLQGDSAIRAKVASKEGETDTKDKADTRQQLEDTVTEGAYDPEAVRSSFSKFASRSLLGLGLICLINGISLASDQIEYFEIMLPMMRMSTEIIAGGDQTKAGDLTATELGFQSQDFYDEKSETSIKDARSVQAELGEPQRGPDIPYSARFGGADDTLEALSSAAGGIPGIRGLCSVAGSWVGFVFELTIDAVTNSALPGLGGIIKELAEDAALGRLASTIANYLAAQPVNLNAKGAELGNYVNYGARLAANDQAIAMGGRELSGAEEVALRKDINEKRGQDFKDQSWTERLFALDNPQSASFKLLSTLPHRQELLSQVSVPTLLNAFGNARNWLVHDNVAADGEEYDYGFPKVAFTPKELEDERFDNPFENERKLFEHIEDSDEDEDTNTINEEAEYLDGLNYVYGQPCFNIALDNNGGFNVGSISVKERLEGDDFDYLGNAAKRIGTKDDMKGHYQKPECRSNNETLMRYRFLILDVITQTSMACYEGDEEACREVGLEETSAVSTAPTESLKHIFEDSSEISCAEGTRNVGVFDGYHEGNKIPIRICGLPGFSSTSPVESFGIENADGEVLVNSRISGNALAMFEAAKKDGVNLAAISTFRTMEHQQSLCPCDGVTVAEPGFSNHQMGLAIDFDTLPSSSGPIPGNPVWEWLSEHAGEYGYKNYPVEAWHWSVTGG